MKPLTADNADGRTLLALRAGPMTPGEISARVGGSVSRWLIKAGYVEESDCYYRITDAGRAACPLRNPLSARGAVLATSSEDESMKVSQQQVFDVIAAAGQGGVRPLEIAARCGMNSVDKVIRNALYQLKAKGLVDTPEHGLYVVAQQGISVRRSGQTGAQQPARKVVEHAAGKEIHATREAVLAWLEKQPKGNGAVPSAVAQGIGCTEDSTRAVLAGLFAGLKVDRQKIGNDFAYFVGQLQAETETPEAPAPAITEQAVESAPQAAAAATAEPPAAIVANTIPESHPRSETVPLGGELAVSALGLGDLAELIKQPMPIMPAVVEDVMLDDPEQVEFAIFSSGGLDIYCAETTVTLNKAVLGKLRNFLGLFAEAA